MYVTTVLLAMPSVLPI